MQLTLYPASLGLGNTIFVKFEVDSKRGFVTPQPPVADLEGGYNPLLPRI